MLKGIDPILGPEALAVLRGMGHGDELVISDANFPSESVGPQVIRMDGHEATRVLDAVLSLMPLDEVAPQAAWHMQVVGDPTGEMPIFGAFRDMIRTREGERYGLFSLERFAFYERAAKAFAVFATGERRLYGNIILKKGIVRPD